MLNIPKNTTQPTPTTLSNTTLSEDDSKLLENVSNATHKEILAPIISEITRKLLININSLTDNANKQKQDTINTFTKVYDELVSKTNEHYNCIDNMNKQLIIKIYYCRNSYTSPQEKDYPIEHAAIQLYSKEMNKLNYKVNVTMYYDDFDSDDRVYYGIHFKVTINTC